MKTKKAQISAQVFIYIMAAIIVGVIVLVGYRSIKTIIDAGSNINIDSFKSSFENTVSTYSRQYNSQTKFDEPLPRNFDEICFADSREGDNKFSSALKSNPGLQQYPFIQSSIQNDAEPNVFLLNDKKISQSFYVENLDVEVDFLCIKSNEKMALWLRGTGKVAVLYTE